MSKINWHQLDIERIRLTIIVSSANFMCSGPERTQRRGQSIQAQQVTKVLDMQTRQDGAEEMVIWHECSSPLGGARCG